MATTTLTPTKHQGGSFLLAPTTPEEVFTPEDFTDEHRAIARTTEEFFQKEVAPNVDAIQHQEPGLAISILRKSAQLGLTAVIIPEKFGGMEMDLVSAMIVAEGRVERRIVLRLARRAYRHRHAAVVDVRHR